MILVTVMLNVVCALVLPNNMPRFFLSCTTPTKQQIYLIRTQFRIFRLIFGLPQPYSSMFHFIVYYHDLKVYVAVVAATMTAKYVRLTVF